MERFLADPDYPAQIAKIRGRYLNQVEVLKIENDIENFLTKATIPKQPVNININEGDVVWNGNRALVVAAH